jgi:hypothetical protein
MFKIYSITCGVKRAGRARGQSMRFYLTADMEFACTDMARDTDGNFEAFLDAVMEALVELEDVDKGITGADLTATITRRRASVDMAIDADTFDDAIRLYLANTRTALHAAGGGTPNWPIYKPLSTTPAVSEVAPAGR